MALRIRKRHSVAHSVRWVWTAGLLFTPCTPNVHAQDTVPLLVRVEDRTRLGPRNRVVARDPATSTDRDIYRSEGRIPYDVTLSEDGRYLAFIEVLSQGGAGTRRVTVLDRAGRIVTALGVSAVYAPRVVREYVWCCDTGTIAVVTGGLGDEAGSGESTTLPVGLSLVDVRTGDVSAVEQLRSPQQINWVPFDSSLYVKDSPQAGSRARGAVRFLVYRYHAPTRTLSVTTRRGVFFSPDGKYYFDRGTGEGSRSIAVYRTSDDENITSQVLPQGEYQLSGPGWQPGADHALVFAEESRRTERPRHERGRKFAREPTRGPQVHSDRWNVIVDAETGRVIDRFQGDIRVGWTTNVRALPVERRTGIDLMPSRRP
jgi:hypothetical protein